MKLKLLQLIGEARQQFGTWIVSSPKVVNESTGRPLSGISIVFENHRVAMVSVDCGDAGLHVELFAVQRVVNPETRQADFAPVSVIYQGRLTVDPEKVLQRFHAMHAEIMSEGAAQPGDESVEVEFPDLEHLFPNGTVH